MVIALSGHEPAREELARVLAALGRVDEGRAILAALALAGDWAGTPPLPHQRRAAATLAPPAPAPAP